jgi:predicted amino acid racemase
MTQPLVPRVLRPRRAAPADAVRPTRADVNLEALRHNLRVVKRHAGGARVWAVLKADGYGHGAPAVARTLERARVDGFCVALLEEAVELREAGIVAPILVMGGHYGNAHEEVVERGLTPVVHDMGQVAAFARLVRSGATPGPVDVHLKIDTGMARLGVTLEELPEVAARLGDFPDVRIQGLMTHLACADALTDDETREQLRRFDEATALLARHGVRPVVRQPPAARRCYGPTAPSTSCARASPCSACPRARAASRSRASFAASCASAPRSSRCATSTPGPPRATARRGGRPAARASPRSPWATPTACRAG